MNLYTLCLHFLRHSFFLLIKVTKSFFPCLDFVKYCADIVLWLTNAALRICNLSKELDDFSMLQLIFISHQAVKIQVLRFWWFLLWRRFYLLGRTIECGHALTLGQPLLAGTFISHWRRCHGQCFGTSLIGGCASLWRTLILFDCRLWSFSFERRSSQGTSSCRCSSATFLLRCDSGASI